MTDVVNVCGTGTWAGPLPGDPNNVLTLSATPAFGGIDVSWSYPTINPHAVAHTLLYRGISNNFGVAVQREVVAGSSFYDKVGTQVTYYYWIRTVSINGTLGDLIGPASATANPMIADFLQILSGQIDAGVLAQSLKGTLDNISVINTNLNDEIFDRETGETSFAQALEDVQDGVAQANSFITTEINSRVAANSAIAEQINLVAVTLGSSIAAVETNSTAWIEDVDGVPTPRAKYFAKVTADGLIGGFGIYNDSSTVEAGFDVNRFWIGKSNPNWIVGTNYIVGALVSKNGLNYRCLIAHTATAPNSPALVSTSTWALTNSRLKPFIVDGDTVYIPNAVIQSVTLDKLRTADNSVVIEDGKIKADYLSGKGLDIKDATGNVILSAGSSVADQLGLGRFNNIVNSGPAPGTIGSFANNAGDTGLSTPSLQASFDPWRPTGQGGVYFTFPGTVTSGKYADMYNTQRWAVVAGNRYEASVYISAHRCQVDLNVQWQDSTGAYLTENGGNRISNAYSGDLSNWANGRSFWIGTAPTGACFASLGVRSIYLGAGYSDPYTFASLWYFGDSTVGQTLPSKWSDGHLRQLTNANKAAFGFSGDLNATANQSDATTNAGIASAATTANWSGVASIPTNVQNALNRAGDSIAGRITMSVADGIFAGTDFNNGVYFGNTGIIGKKAGTTTFGIDTAGNAVFGGALTAATGTFAGSLTAGAINAVNTINIGANQVTIPAGVQNAAAMDLLGYNPPYQSLSLSVDTGGFPLYVQIGVIGVASHGGSGTNSLIAKLFVNSVEQYSRTIAIAADSAPDRFNYSMPFYAASPGTGTVSVELRLSRSNISAASSVQIDAGNAILFAIGTKR